MSGTKRTYPALYALFADNTTGDISAQDARDLITSIELVGINFQTGTTYTPVLADSGYLIDLANAAAIAFTVPSNASVAYDIGTVLVLRQGGDGTVTIETGAGVTIESEDGTLTLPGKFAAATLTKTAVDTWWLHGTAIVGGGSGEVVESTITQTAHGFTVGAAVRHNGTSYVAATADTAANAEAIGIVTAVADADNFTLTTHGVVTTLSGLTAGSVYFLQDAGGLGTAEGTISKPMLIATSATGGIALNYRGLQGSPGDMLKSVYDTDDDGKVDKAERVEENTTTIAASGTAQSLDLATATVFDMTLTGNCAVTVTNTPTGAFGFTLIVRQDATGSRLISSYPTGTIWAGGTAPTLSTAASAVDVLTFITPNGGTTWFGMVAGLAFA